MREVQEPDFDLALDAPRYDGTEDPITRLLYIKSYKGAPLMQSKTYVFMIKSRNWVGWSANSDNFILTLPLRIQAD